ncbi:MSHA biogenesis protein MshF [Shewanella algicola]|uniref:MSHA biogenesis protein MshF n=1 Tax=Shewanella algicola TaxID=640633 RepID=A0A9X1Z7P6_9GAMM|nr:hypothetical protein [Shewanella algicola]MCL1106657.1 hypothetical protein [Shewanella algicola]GGP61325.1 MSHA biogenesis protein MshF [Shewanella algicola]
MLNQQKADDDLLKVYGKLIAIVVLIILVGILGGRYVNTAPNLTSQGLAFEHNRLLNVLAMVRSQWLASGRPNKMLLSWYDVAPNVLTQDKSNNNAESSKNGRLDASAQIDNTEAELVGTNNWIQLSSNGWPLVETYDEDGCRQLWQQLLAIDVNELGLTVVYQAEDKVCRFTSANQASLSYQLQTGRIIYLAAE